MRAAILRDPSRPLEIADCQLADPHPGEVRVALRASGVCHSDANFVDGSKPYPLPVILGHEGAGVVTAVGDGTRGVRPGDHVVLAMTPSCGYCRACLHGHGAVCPNVPHRSAGAMPDGTRRLSCDGEEIHHFVWLSTFAEEVVVPESVCVPIRSDAPLDTLAVLACGATTGVMSAFSAGIRLGDAVAVFGCGGVGLAVVMGAALSGAREIIAIDPGADKVQAARELGATTGIVAPADAATAEVRERTGGGAEVVFEATGRLDVMNSVLSCCAESGTTMIVGVATSATAKLTIPYAWLRRNRRLLGSHFGAAEIRRDIPDLVELYMSGRLPIDAMISNTRPLSEINDAFADMHAGSAMRTVIDFELEEPV